MKAKLVVNSGYAYGKLLIEETETVKYIASSYDEEVEKFETSIKKCLLKLEEMKKSLPVDLFDDYSFIDAHKLLLMDHVFTDGVKDYLKANKCNASYAIETFIDEYVKMIDQSDDRYLKERALDLSDIKNQLLGSIEAEKLKEISEDSILVVKDLFPTTVVNISKHIKGIIAYKGSDISHSAILCKALDIPYLVVDEKITGEYALIDDEEIFVDPNDYQVSNVVLKKKEYGLIKDLPFNLYANVGSEKEFSLVKKHGFNGVGLFRTEILFITRGRLLNFAEQKEIYQNLSIASFPKTVSIRTFDIGDDKQLPFMPVREKGMAVYEEYSGPLKTQIDAITEANQLGNLQVMFPMIRSNDEFQNLRHKVISKSKDIRIGMMLETKDALDNIESFENVDFISIGTNDLFQELYGISRFTATFDYRNKQDDLLQRFNKLVCFAKTKGIEICICGELASDYQFIGLMRTIGINNFSINISSLNRFKDK